MLAIVCFWWFVIDQEVEEYTPLFPTLDSKELPAGSVRMYDPANVDMDLSDQSDTDDNETTDMSDVLWIDPIVSKYGKPQTIAGTNEKNLLKKKEGL